MDDSVQIKCNRCKSVFRDRARRLQNGYSRQCPSCEVVLFFDEDSQAAQHQAHHESRAPLAQTIARARGRRRLCWDFIGLQIQPLFRPGPIRRQGGRLGYGNRRRPALRHLFSPFMLG
jgi:phage FluMu protein Com